MPEFAVARRNQNVLATPWLELGAYVEPDGRERCCSCCREWLPMDDEFFGFLATRGHFRSACRACEAVKARAYRARVKLRQQVRRARKRRRLMVTARRSAWKEPARMAA